MAHLDLGRQLFIKIKQELFMVSKVERDAKMEGRRMTLVLQPDHKQPGAKPPGQASAPAAGARSGSMSAGSRLNIPVPAPVPQTAAPTPEPATR